MGHWYNDKGEACYTQPMAKDPTKTRGTTLRDAKKLNLFPSVTTIIGQLDKPALTRWMINEMLQAALTVPPHDGESTYMYEKRLWAVSKQKGKKAADKGTEIHNLLEGWFLDGSNGHNPYVQAVITKMDDLFGEQAWVPEMSFCKHGYGGKIDLHCASSGMYSGIVLDFKTKDLIKMNHKKSMVYPENKLQLSAYGEGVGLKEPLYANVFIGRELSKGEADVKIETYTDTHLEEFMLLLRHWQLRNGRLDQYEQGIQYEKEQICTATAI